VEVDGKMEFCPKCGTKLLVIETPNLIHSARLDCPKHGFIKWLPSEKNKDKKRRRASKYSLYEVAKYHNFKEPFCFFCLRKKEQLGVKETLTIDHIQELSIGGKDELSNLQILCSACHKLKNWARLYMNWHLNGGDTNDNS